MTEIEELRAKVDKYEHILKCLFPSKYNFYFVCGDMGNKDEMGLPEKLLVCPAEGLDGFAVYSKTKDYTAPGW